MPVDGNVRNGQSRQIRDCELPKQRHSACAMASPVKGDQNKRLKGMFPVNRFCIRCLQTTPQEKDSPRVGNALCCWESNP